MAMRPLLMLATLWVGHCGCSQREIHLAGIFPIKGVEGWQGGQACEPAANLALQDVNAQPNILPGYTLKLHWDDSGVRLKERLKKSWPSLQCIHTLSVRLGSRSLGALRSTLHQTTKGSAFGRMLNSMHHRGGSR